MKKIFLFVVSAISAVTLMAQELPTACDATIAFKYCFDIETAATAASYELPYTYNYTDDQGQEQSVTFTTGEESHIIKTLTDRGCVNTITLTWAPKLPPVGAAGGNNAKGFSVGVDGNGKPKQVFFAQGNLLYRYTDGSAEGLSRVCADGTTQPGIFRFAEHQYSHGKINSLASNISCLDASGQTIVCDDTKRNMELYSGYAGYFSTLPWGGSGYGIYEPRDPTSQYYNPSWTGGSQYADRGFCIPTNIANTYYDWGVYNPIENGGNECGLWRGISAEELAYIITKRENASAKVAKATVKDDNEKSVYGLIILPDDWTLPADITFNSGWQNINEASYPVVKINQMANPAQYDYSYNSYTLEQWQKMEAAGAVFLPVTSYDNNYRGYYYTTNAQRDGYNTNGFILTFQPLRQASGNNYTSIILNYTSSNGSVVYGVRLVSDKKD